MYDKRPKNQIKRSDSINQVLQFEEKKEKFLKVRVGNLWPHGKYKPKGCKFERFLSRYCLVGEALWKLLTADFNWWHLFHNGLHVYRTAYLSLCNLKNSRVVQHLSNIDMKCKYYIFKEICNVFIIPFSYYSAGST